MRPGTGTYVLGGLMLLTLAWVFAASFLSGPRQTIVHAALLAVLAMVLAGGMIVLRLSKRLPRGRLVDVVVGAVTAFATLYLSRVLEVPPLVAASMVAVAVGVAMLGDGPLDPRSGAAGYSGAFVGIMPPTVTIGWYWVVLAGAVAGLLWTFIGPSVLDGAGGRMGTVAFMASIPVYLAADILHDRGNAPLLPPISGLAHWAVVPTGCIAALVTWLLMYRLGWSLPMASGLTSLFVCGGLVLWGPPALQVAVGATWYGGTAVGGTAATRLPNAAWIGLTGLAYGGLMLRFSGPLQGHVGVIGATGLMAVLGIVAARRVLQRAARRLAGQPRVA